MQKEKKSLRALLLITTPKQADRAAALCAEAHVPIQYQFPAHGTASSEIMDLLGLGNTNKSILIALSNKFEADNLLNRMYDRLNMGATNSGIAFTLPLTGCSRLLINLLETPGGNALPIKESEPTAMSDYTMIVTLVDQGFSEEVMSAARTAGARGGTVISVRRNEDEVNSETWGVNLLAEKEAVIILTENGQKAALMAAISARCGMNSEAQGIVFSMPIDSAIGLGQNKQITTVTVTEEAAVDAPKAPTE